MSVYFMYSREQIDEKNKVLSSLGKQFVPGNVVVNGKREKFTQLLTNTSAMSRFPDAKIIASGDTVKDFTYTAPTTEIKRG